MDNLLYAVDWSLCYRPAALAVLSGQSPYSVSGFVYVPWATFPMLPLALLPEPFGRLSLLFLMLALFAFTAWRLGAGPIALVAFLLSPPVIHSLLNGTFDALVLVGAVLPPPVGLFLLAIKPQLGAGIAAFWLVEAYRERRLLVTFGPVTIAILASFALFGLWPIAAARDAGWSINASLWPYSIPAGLALLGLAILKRRPSPALAAGPFLSPYLLFHSWSAALVALVRRPVVMVLISITLWALVLAQI